MFNLMHPRLHVALASLIAALIVGSIVRFLALRGADPDLASKRLASLRTWWVLALLFSAALLIGSAGVMLLLIVASGLALREFTRICGLGGTDRVAAGLAWLAIPLHYALVLWGSHDLSLFLLPLGLPLALGGWKAASSWTTDFLRSAAALSWGVLLLVYAPSFALRVCTLPDEWNHAAGPAGWLLYLLILTEMNDISQALVGRRLGAHKITPRVSPKKSWEGLVGGVIVTTLLALLLAPWLTALADGDRPGSFLLPLLAGLLIAISGFLGDINMSAVKRDAGVKDGSTLLPGQGGVIDRIDSLTFTAPVFYCFVRWALPA